MKIGELVPLNTILNLALKAITTQNLKKMVVNVRNKKSTFSTGN